MNQNSLKIIVENLFSNSPFSVDEAVFEYDEGQNMYWYRVKSKESHLLIGKNGETLQALNHLVRRIIESKHKEECAPPAVLIDINNYQFARIENVKAVAHTMAERARFFKSNIEIDPMNAFDRKIIHTFLEGKSDIKTESSGVGRDRRVVIKYVGNI